MDRDFVYRQTLVWLEHELIVVKSNDGPSVIFTGLPFPPWDALAQSLTDHLCNNFEQVERAKIKQTIKHLKMHNHLHSGGMNPSTSDPQEQSSL